LKLKDGKECERKREIFEDEALSWMAVKWLSVQVQGCLSTANDNDLEAFREGVPRPQAQVPWAFSWAFLHVYNSNSSPATGRHTALLAVAVVSHESKVIDTSVDD
jgi:hypothetical protein